MDKHRFEIDAAEVYVYRVGWGRLRVFRSNGYRQKRRNIYHLTPARLVRAQRLQAALAKAAQGEIE